MQQRQLRLGDILDDYCPRERRVTNHAVVAMIGADIKQTRCTTCDAEHPYKGSKIPLPRKKKVMVPQASPILSGDQPAAPPIERAAEKPGDAMAASASSAVEPNTAEGGEGIEPIEATEEGRAHRPLIRATLPRTEGQTTARPVPEFTIRQAGTRHGKFHGHQTGGSHYADRSKGRGQPGQNARPPGSRPGAGGRHANRPGHAPHGAGPYSPQPRHPHPGARSRNKRPR